jgi:hypothetical protein
MEIELLHFVEFGEAKDKKDNDLFATQLKVRKDAELTSSLNSPPVAAQTVMQRI